MSGCSPLNELNLADPNFILLPSISGCSPTAFTIIRISHELPFFNRKFPKKWVNRFFQNPFEAAYLRGSLFFHLLCPWLPHFFYPTYFLRFPNKKRQPTFISTVFAFLYSPLCILKRFIFGSILHEITILPYFQPN